MQAQDRGVVDVVVLRKSLTLGFKLTHYPFNSIAVAARLHLTCSPKLPSPYVEFAQPFEGAKLMRKSVLLKHR